MIVRTYIKWVALRIFLKKKDLFSRCIMQTWSYTLVEGDCNVFCSNNLHLMSFENRILFNLKLLLIFLNKQMLRKYAKRQTAHL